MIHKIDIKLVIALKSVRPAVPSETAKTSNCENKEIKYVKTRK